jgi:transcriptional regulator with PAS, ATPase and Fis domain
VPAVMAGHQQRELHRLPPGGLVGHSGAISLKAILWRARVRAVRQALVAHGGNAAHAAKELGISRGYVSRVLKHAEPIPRRVQP